MILSSWLKVSSMFCRAVRLSWSRLPTTLFAIASRLGTEVAKRLGTFVGDFVSILSDEGTLSPVGNVPVRQEIQGRGDFLIRVG